MSNNLSARIIRLEERLGTHTCTTCYGHAYAMVFVPNEADEDKPEWNPTHCKECGVPLQAVQRIVGISEEEMFPELAESAG